MEFVVKSHTPQINESNIDRDVIITVLFTEGIDPSSINYKVLTVRDDKYNIIPGEVYLDFTDKGTINSVGNILVFKPNSPLTANIKYSVYINKSPECLKSVSGKYINNIYKFSFTTSNTISDNVSLTRKEQLELDLQKAVNEHNYILAGELQKLIDDITTGVTEDIPNVVGPIIPPNVIIPEFNVISTTPKKETSNLNTDNVNYIKITMNDSIAISSLDIADFISFTYKDVLE